MMLVGLVKLSLGLACGYDKSLVVYGFFYALGTPMILAPQYYGINSI
jgi:hypothetical protein